jgi:uncharacterized protein with von Willebrand factor type A (vWA) domain
MPFLAQSHNTMHTRHRRVSTIQCHDCREQVAELKIHRALCVNSKLNKSKLKPITATPPRRTTRPETSMDFYALIDVSASMSGTRLEQAKSVMQEFFASMKEEDRLSIITFDTGAFFKLKPRPVGQIRRQNELDGILGRIRAGGCTALYDAIYMAIEQLRDKNQKTFLNVLTDGEDNASKHTFAEVQALVAQCPGVRLNIVHVDHSGKENAQYQELCRNRGDYIIIQETQITSMLTRVYKSCTF